MKNNVVFPMEIKVIHIPKTHQYIVRTGATEYDFVREKDAMGFARDLARHLVETAHQQRERVEAP
jgi:hypothetical protein